MNATEGAEPGDDNEPAIAEIPLPSVLDPKRLSQDSDASRLSTELTMTCNYGEQLWQQLDGVRHYLLDATPSSSTDDEAWRRWSQMYASVTTMLCGPRGDSGFGREEAEREARDRRSAAST